MNTSTSPRYLLLTKKKPHFDILLLKNFESVGIIFEYEYIQAIQIINSAIFVYFNGQNT